MAALLTQGQRPPNEAAASPYNLILEHVFSKPLAYDIPLRSMFAINSASLDHHPAQQNAQQNPQQHPQQNPQQDADDIRSKQDARAAANADFKSALLQHIATLPSQPCSLPRSFTTAFLRKCFTSDFALVDFTQALTGIDYLKDLDNLRKRELAATLQRIGVDRAEASSFKDPAIAAWVRDTEEKENKVEALYTQLFIGLRRWTIINELSLVPFHKHNCHALLNTLYPPISTSQPTAALTPQVLRTQRQSFFDYINAVERHGRPALAPLLTQGRRRPTDETGWPAVSATLDAYLVIANALMHEYGLITGPQHFHPAAAASDARRDRKKDSGISFGSSSSADAAGPAVVHASYRLTPPSLFPHPPPRTTLPSPPPPPVPPPPHRQQQQSTLERIANELRRIRSRRKLDVSAAALAAAKERMRAETLNALRDGPPSPSPPSRPQQGAATPTPQSLASRRSLPTPKDPRVPDKEAAPPNSQQQHQQQQHQRHTSALRRLRSLGDLRSSQQQQQQQRADGQGGNANASTTKDDAAVFDRDEMLRQRLLWEARARRKAADAEAAEAAGAAVAETRGGATEV